MPLNNYIRVTRLEEFSCLYSCLTQRAPVNKTSEEASDADDLVYVALVGWNFLCGLGWLWVHRDPSPSVVLRLKVNATIPG